LLGRPHRPELAPKLTTGSQRSGIRRQNGDACVNLSARVRSQLSGSFVAWPGSIVDSSGSIVDPPGSFAGFAGQMSRYMTHHDC